MFRIPARMTICKLTAIGVLSVISILVNEINCFQRFAEQPKYTEVNPGQDALLTCKIIDKRGTCSWQKDNKPVGIYPKKYEWAGTAMIIHQSMQPPHIGGDCSLWIRSATLDFDDGLWECQVTASDFTTQDALTSQPVRLVVRVAPQRPRLEHEGVHVPPGHNVTVDAGAVATVKCISHYGNPPAQLKWFLGDQEISPLGPQLNNTEQDNPRTWSASSVVQVPASRERHGEMLKCIALHESYAAKSVAVEARMDVKYAPTIRLLGAPEIDLEEGKDTLILRCEADANPPASIVWRRAGRSEIASLQESLQLRPVGRRDAGLYTCQAQNSVGSSEQLSIQLDVKYPPRILSAGPDRLTTAPLFSPAAFECLAEGNPPPTYKWVQRISGGSKYLERGHESRLVIDNVTYDYQGEYECRATNFINGQERTVASEPVSLQVVGAPQVLRLNPSMHSVSVKKGESASLSLVVCADPRPHHVAWEWGSLRLEAGAGVDRYRADEVTQDSREDCYLATLHITRADEHDARPYYLVVENERGTDRHAIHLSVEEPLEMSYLLGIAGGCLAALLILICLCIYAIRAKKCCFKGRSGYKSSDKDSEKADLKSRSDSTSGPQGDSIYTTPAGFHHHHHAGHGSPEAMKSTTLQNGQLWKPRAGAPAGSGLYATTKLGAQRHQRDLFTGDPGDLGIPEIKTRVGSVVHTFETMAMLKQQEEDMKSKYATTGKTKSYRSGRMSSNSKYTQLKKKSAESRNRMAISNLSPSSSLPRLSSQENYCSDSRFTTNALGTSPGRSNYEDTIYNVDEDYRKNLFGTQPYRKHRSSSTHENNPEDEVVNKAFDEIFKSYGQDGGESSNIQDEEVNNNRSKKFHPKPKRSSTLTDIFECARSKATKTGKAISKYPSSSLLSGEKQKCDFNYEKRKNRSSSRPSDPERETLTNFSDDNENFLRGSTVSQSFIKDVKNRGLGSTPISAPTTTGAHISSPTLIGNPSGTSTSPPPAPSTRRMPEVDASGRITSCGGGNYSKTAARDGIFLMTANRKKSHPAAMMNQQKRSKSSSEIVDELQSKHFNETRTNLLPGSSYGSAGGVEGSSAQSGGVVGVGTVTGSGGGSGLRGSRKGNFKPRYIDRAEI